MADERTVAVGESPRRRRRDTTVGKSSGESEIILLKRYWRQSPKNTRRVPSNRGEGATEDHKKTVQNQIRHGPHSRTGRRSDPCASETYYKD